LLARLHVGYEHGLGREQREILVSRDRAARALALELDDIERWSERRAHGGEARARSDDAVELGLLEVRHRGAGRGERPRAVRDTPEHVPPADGAERDRLLLEVIGAARARGEGGEEGRVAGLAPNRKSTRLNSSH